MELFAQLKTLLAPPALDEGLRLAIQRGVSIVDPLIKAVPNYEQKLAASARHAMDYCARLTADIPGPIDINGRVFVESPLVHAFFSRAEQISEMLGRSQAVREFLAAAGAAQGEEFFALLGLRRHEKTVMGAGLQGDQVRREVPQTLLYFSDHTLLALSAELAATRNSVGALAFDSLAKTFAGELAQLRYERQQLHTQWELARAAKGEAGAGSSTLRELERRMAEVNEQLMPERVLQAYLAFLASPADYLRLEPVTLTVDRLGVLLNPAVEAAGAADTISFPELMARDRRRWILTLVRIRREEVVKALQAFEEAHRYLLI